MADDDLGPRLDEALHGRLDPGGVDTDALLAGSRRRAATVRTRRRTLVAAVAVLVLAVPVAYEVTGPPPGAVPPTAMMTGRPLAAAGDPVAVPAEVGAFAVPPGLRRVGGSVDPAGAAAAGLACPGIPPLAVRTWSYAGTSVTEPRAGRTVVLTVVRWPAGAGARVLAGVVAGGGECGRAAVPDGVRGRPAGDRTWAFTTPGRGDGPGVARVVFRAGDLISVVEATDAGDDGRALELATGMSSARHGLLEWLADGRSRPSQGAG